MQYTKEMESESRDMVFQTAIRRSELRNFLQPDLLDALIKFNDLLYGGDFDHVDDELIQSALETFRADLEKSPIFNLLKGDFQCIFNYYKEAFIEAISQNDAEEKHHTFFKMKCKMVIRANMEAKRLSGEPNIEQEIKKFMLRFNTPNIKTIAETESD